MATSTLTNLIPDLYAALDVVSRELVGFIPAVSRDSTAERAAVDEDVRIPVTTSESASDISASNTPPDDGGNTVNNRKLTITEARDVAVSFTGEEERGLRNAGTFENIRQQRFFQAMRTLVNEIETDLAGTYTSASRAYGTEGTTPFGTKDDFSDFAGVMEILDENGAPNMDRQLAAGSAAWSNLRGTQTGILQRANEAGTVDALREGEFGDVHGMALRNSGQVQSHASGSSVAWVVNSGGGLSEGATDIPVDGGAGGDTVSAGDIVSFAGDSGEYVVSSGLTGASGTFSINEPGLQSSIADDASVTQENTSNAYAANLAFHRDAIQLATRAPALPSEGDMASDRTIIQDDVSGLAFEVAQYPQYRQVQYRIGLAWGWSATKPEHIALLLG